MKFSIFILLPCFIFILSGCAQILPVPGGTDTVNRSFYESKDDMQERLKKLEVGMTKENVFSILNRDKEELDILKREEIVSALFGGSDSNLKDDWNGETRGRYFIQSLSGHRLNYKILKRKHGINSPIGVRTDEKGFSYSAVLIFKDDYLYEKPIISGGIIDNSSSSTIFDFLNPGVIMDEVR
jgi:hypothetical protein